MSSPSRVRGTAPAASDFSYIQIKYELIFGHQCIQFVNVGTNLGHQAKTWTHGRPRRTVIFLGQVVKNQDCPGKSGMDGHLNQTSNVHKCDWLK